VQSNAVRRDFNELLSRRDTGFGTLGSCVENIRGFSSADPAESFRFENTHRDWLNWKQNKIR
jgi:hypothetical protein